jgi:hypothetical protein
MSQASLPSFIGLFPRNDLTIKDSSARGRPGSSLADAAVEE